MASTTFVPTPPSSSPVSSIQGGIVYGDGNPSTVTVITYAFGTDTGSQAWTEAYKAEFRAALAEIEAVANISFVETTDTANADLVEVIAPSTYFGDSRTLGFHYTPFTGPSLGAYSTAYWTANSGLGGNGDPGGYFFTTLIHELGHALGLGHPHDTGLGTTIMSGVTSAFNSFGVGTLNQGVYTVMSYNDGWTSQNGPLFVNATYGGSTGYGALDIAALQAMYGANTTYNTGNNTYVLPSANVAGTGYQAIWDAGGIDTIQHVGSLNARIDLTPATLDYSNTGGGVISYAGGIDGGFTIANGVIIENASGGSGDDQITGNVAQNTLWGNNGNDTITSVSNGTNNNTIYGGFGNDTIYLAFSSGADQVFGDQGNDLAVVAVNGGSFTGGTGTDTVRFNRAISTYLFFDNGTSYEFLDVVARVSFTIASDVELIQFQGGSQQYTKNNIQAAMQLTDIDNQGTTFKHADQGIYVLDSGGANLALIKNGQVIGDSSIAGWQAIQAEASGGGYRILWQNTNDGSYGEWVTNASGQFISSSALANVANVETFYNVDLNNDGTIGHASNTIESDGSTTLVYSTQNGYLINGSIQLTRDGANAGSNSYPGWQAIHAEADGGGYRILWQNTDGSYGEWVTDASGRYISSNAINNIIDVEIDYGVDLNNDGQIGHFTTSIEADGSNTLGSSTRGVYVIDDTIDLTRNGVNAGPDSFPGWQAIHAEADGGGYRILWQNTNGSYGEWITDSSGAYISSGDTANVVDLETVYNADLNNDGTIGHKTTTIESDGSNTLGSSTRGVYVIDDTIDLTRNGVGAGPDSFPGWQAIHAEADGGGYRVLWQNTNGSYGEWITDSSGVYISSGDTANVVDLETVYNADLNNDGTIGHKTTTIESDGSNTLGSSTRGVYVIDDTIDLTRNGVNAGPDSFPGWQAIHAEASGTGYRVLWQHTDGTYGEWITDGSGVYISSSVVPDVTSVETFYGADIDGSGGIGKVLPKLAAIGSVEQKPASTDEVLDLADWDETTDLLKFVPEMTVEADAEDTYTLVEMFNVRSPGLPGADKQVEITWFNNPRNEVEDDIDPLLASLLEEDGFLL